MFTRTFVYAEGSTRIYNSTFIMEYHFIYGNHIYFNKNAFVHVKCLPILFFKYFWISESIFYTWNCFYMTYKTDFQVLILLEHWVHMCIFKIRIQDLLLVHVINKIKICLLWFPGGSFQATAENSQVLWYFIH